MNTANPAYYTVSFIGSDNDLQKYKTMQFAIDPGVLQIARAEVATGALCSYANPDMAQYGYPAIVNGSAYLFVPHTGFCYCHKIDHLVFSEFPGWSTGDSKI